MALDSRDKRASCLGIALPFLAVLPEPAGAVAGADRAQLAYAYRLFDIAGVTIYLRQATDVALVSDAILPQRLRTQQVLEGTTLADLSGLIRQRHAAVADTLDLTDAVLRFLQLPGAAVIIRQVRDILEVWDLVHVQRDRVQWLLEILTAADTLGDARLRPFVASDVLGLADDFGVTRERRRGLVDWLENTDSSTWTSDKTRQLIDVLRLFDWIDRFYLPYIVDYRPLRGIQVHDGHVHGVVRLQRNYLGVLAHTAAEHTASTRRMSPFGFVLHQHQGATQVSLIKPLGVTVGAHRISKTRQKRPV